jgi:ABC-type polar amino acid transport system ATPase subunit
MAVGRALCRRLKLVFDEVHSALDRIAVRWLRGVLWSLLERELG